MGVSRPDGGNSCHKASRTKSTITWKALCWEWAPEIIHHGKVTLIKIWKITMHGEQYLFVEIGVSSTTKIICGSRSFYRSIDFKFYNISNMHPQACPMLRINWVALGAFISMSRRRKISIWRGVMAAGRNDELISKINGLTCSMHDHNHEQEYQYHISTYHMSLKKYGSW